MLITLEGGEGGGKTTAINVIPDWLKSEYGIVCQALREPGGTYLGDSIRQLLHEITPDPMSPKAEALLYQASRAEIVAKIIKPGLAARKFFVLDRFMDSSKMYQGIGRGLGDEVVDWLNNFSTDGIIPDLTLLFDLAPEIGLQRRMGNNLEMNRMDLQELDFYRKVRVKYLEIATANVDGRWRIINAEQPLEIVINDAKREIENKLISSGFIERPTFGKER